MKALAQKHPPAFGIVATILIVILFFFAHGLFPSGISNSTRILLDSALRFLFAIPCIWLMGFISNTNGFHDACKPTGLTKGLFASLTIMLFMATMIGKFFIMVSVNESYLPNVPVVLLQQVATGLFEEALFRGVLMSGMLLVWGGSKVGRVSMVILSGIIFGMAHLANGGALNDMLRNALGAGIMGIAYSAVYLYSGSLLSCMVLHAAYDIAAHLSGGIIASVSGGWALTIMQTAQPILLYAAIPAFAIVVSLIAKPAVESATRLQASNG